MLLLINVIKLFCTKGQRGSVRKGDSLYFSKKGLTVNSIIIRYCFNKLDEKEEYIQGESLCHCRWWEPQAQGDGLSSACCTVPSHGRGSFPHCSDVTGLCGFGQAGRFFFIAPIACSTGLHKAFQYIPLQQLFMRMYCLLRPVDWTWLAQNCQPLE